MKNSSKARATRLGVSIRPARFGASPVQRMMVRNASSTSARSGRSEEATSRSRSSTLTLDIMTMVSFGAERRVISDEWAKAAGVPGSNKAEALHDVLGHALAAFAREGKGVEHHRADLAIEMFAHQLARAMQPRLHRLDADTEQFGGVLDAHALDHPRHEYGAVDIRQLVGHPLDKTKKFALGHGAFWIGSSDIRELNDLGGLAGRLDLGEFGHRASCPQAAKRFVHDDARQPGGETRVAAESRQMRKGADVSFLHRIFRFGVVAQNAPRDPVEPAVVLGEDRAKGAVVAALRGADQHIVARGLVQRGKARLIMRVGHPCSPCCLLDGATRKRLHRNLGPAFKFGPEPT